MRDKNKVQLEMLSFIRRQLKSRKIPDIKLLESTKRNLEKLARDPFEKRSFLYLNVLDWVTGKLQNTTVDTIIQMRNQRVKE